MPLGIIFSTENEAQKLIIKTFCSHAKNNRVSDMEKLLQEHPSFNIDSPFTNGFTALHYACRHKALDSTLFLLKIGADLRMPAKDDRSTTPLDFCSADPLFKKTVLEADNMSKFMKILNMSQERDSRFYLKDLQYETIFLDAHNSNKDKILSMLYAITGDKFDISARKINDKYVYDVMFDSRDSGKVASALVRAGIPHEYVNSKYLIAPDIKSDENIAKLKEFYFNPQNKYYLYCEDELKENRLKDSERGSSIKDLSHPQFILDKYFSLAPKSAGYLLEPKNDPESQLYFDRTLQKLNPIPDYNIKYEQLAAKARESLSKTFENPKKEDPEEHAYKKAKLSP